MQKPGSLSPELLRKAKAGDLAAFERILFAYEKAIFNYVYRLVSHKQNAEDLTQETFIKLYKNLSKIKPEDNFQSWLYKIATNTVYDWLRKKKHITEIWIEQDNEALFETMVAQTAYVVPEAKIDDGNLVKALNKLRPIYKSVLLMYYYNDLSYQDIAHALSVPINTVKTYLHRAKLSLKRQFEAV